MRIKIFLTTLVAGVLLAMMTVSAAAQVGKIEGDVKKQGSGEPIAGALIEIFRTDIKWNDKVTSDKKGHFLHAGIQLGGTYRLLVSAPNCAPTYFDRIRADQGPLTVELGPGDGHRLTADDVRQAQQQQQAAGKAAAPGGAGKSGEKSAEVSEAELKKQNEEIAKKNADIQKHNTNINEVNKLLTNGNQLLNSKDYNGAITSYNEAIKLLPDEYVLYHNLAVALQNRGVQNYNAKQRDEAKKDWTDSANSEAKALSLFEAQIGSDQTKANDPKNKAAKLSYLRVKADSEVFLAAHIGDTAQAEAAAKDFQALIEMTTDPAEKKSYNLKLADTYFKIGKMDETIQIYQQVLQTDANNLDALYGLGLAYASMADGSKTKEAVDLWNKFVAKAPANDSRIPIVQEALKSLSVGLAQPKAEDKNAKKKVIKQ